MSLLASLPPSSSPDSGVAEALGDQKYCLAIEKKSPPPSIDPLPPSQFHPTGASSPVYALLISEA